MCECVRKKEREKERARERESFGWFDAKGENPIIFRMKKLYYGN